MNRPKNNNAHDAVGLAQFTETMTIVRFAMAMAGFGLLKADGPGQSIRGWKTLNSTKHMKNTTTIESQLDSLLPEWTRLVASLIPDIGDDYRATDDPDDDTPGMCLTIGFTPETDDTSMSWHYQTGDNSYSGGAYFHANWAVVSLYRDSDPAEIANDISSQLAECFWQ